MTGAEFFAKGRQGQLSDAPVELSAAEQLPHVSPARHGDVEAMEAEDFEQNDTSSDFDLDSLGAEPGEVSEEDFGWLEGLKQYKQIHDMDTSEVLAALQNGEIPQNLWDKVLMPMKDGDREFTMSLAELRDNGMIRANYTRKMQEFAKERDAFNQEKQDLRTMFEGWHGNPGQMLAQLEKMQLPVLEMAHMLGDRYRAVEQLKAQEAAGTIPEGSADAYLERLQLKQQLEEANYAQQRLQQAQQAQTQQKDGKAVVAQIEATVRKFFQVDGVKESPGSWNVLRGELRAIWDAKGRDQDLTEAEIRMAVRNTKQIVDGHLAQAKTAAPAAAPAISAQPMTSSRGPQVNPRGQVKRMSGAEFRKKVGVGGGLR